MNAIYTLLVMSVVSGILTCIFAFILHRSKWHKTIKKSPFGLLNFFVTNVYQFNGRFLGAVSLSISIPAAVIICNILFIIFYCNSFLFEITEAMVVMVSAAFIRGLLLLIAYSFFYDENLLKD